VTPTDDVIRQIEPVLRAALTRASGRTGVSIRVLLEDGRIEVTAKVVQYEERGR
jgi:hypothetical protein